MSAITTHVLDLSSGRPASGIHVRLEARRAEDEWAVMGQGDTDTDGRIRTLVPAQSRLACGIYRLTFATQAYFERHGIRSFYPQVAVVFEVSDGDADYHVPLLVSPFGYSTYRGS